MRKVNSLGNRLIALTLSVFMVLGMFPSGVVAVDNSSLYGVVESLTDGVTINEIGKDIKVSFAGNLNWVAADTTVGRNSDGWWIGLKVTAPETISIDTAKYTSGGQEKSFKDYNDSEDDANVQFIQLWSLVKEEYLRSANLTDGLSTYTWTFDWDGNGEYEQTMTLDIDADQTILYKDGNTQVYPAESLGYGKLDMLTAGATVTGNESANIAASYENELTVDWVTADTSVGRYQDGWWAGMKITVPDGMTEEQLKEVQYMSGEAVKSFWTYKDSKEGDAAHFMTMWVPLNKLLTGNLEPYKYQFDWNNDGIFEQSLVMSVDASKVILTKSGVQVYPVLGEVTTLTGGSISGSGTGKVDITASGLTLSWSKADASIGRYQDGWWAGIQITAPSGTILTEEDDVKYQSMVVGRDADWSAVKSLFENQDSAVDASKHYMTMWTALNREMVEAGQDLVTKWRFDWDKDGEYEQVVTFTIETANITLLRKDPSDFVFSETATDKKVWIGQGTCEDLKATSTLSDGNVTYALDASSTPGAAQIDATTGKITFNDVGTVTVNATIAQTDVYEAKTISYTFEIVKIPVDGFAISKPSAITYSENKQFENIAYDPTGNGEVNYVIVSQESLEGESLDEMNPVAIIPDETQGILDIKRSGVVTVNAVRVEDGLYLETIDTYTLTVNRAEQSGKFADNASTELTYSETEAYEMPRIEGYEVENAKLSYAITAVDGAAEQTVDNQIKTNHAGDFVLTVTIAGDDRYNAQVLSREMTVALAPQNMENFLEKMTEDELTVTYNENGNLFSNSVIGGSGNGEVSYEVLDGSHVAKCDENDLSTLIIKQSGDVTVKVVKASDGRYDKTEYIYTLTVERASQSFTFSNTMPSIVYGDETFTADEILALIVPNKLPESADGEGFGTGDYSISIAENDIGAYLEGDGNILFNANAEKQVGIVEVTVTKAYDEKYDTCDNTFALTVAYAEAPAYTIVDVEGQEKKPNANGWYDSDIYIKADGWLVSKTNGRDTNDWAERLLYSTESDNGTMEFAFKKVEDNSISDMATISNIKLDKNAPESLDIGYDEDLKWFEIIDQWFGFEKETVSVTLKAADAVADIDYIYYSTDGGNTNNIDAPVELVDGKYVVELPAQYRDSVVLWAVDKAGHTSKLEGDRIIVVDAITPELTVEYDYNNGNYVTTEGVIYADKNVGITFKINADNFDLSEKPVVKVNGIQRDVSWSTAGTMNTSSVLELAVNTDSVMTLSFVDRLGRAVSYEQEIRTDDTNPVISVSYDPAEGNTNGLYFKEDRVATVKITEHNFDAAKVKAVVTAKNILGKNVEAAEISAIAEYLSKPGSWTPVKGAADTYEAQVTFATDAHYTFSIDCADIVGNPAETYEAEPFVVDHEAPVDLKIEYSEPAKDLWTSFLSAITFGYYNPNADKPLVVTLTATDEIAGVDYFEWFYTREEGAAEASNILYVSQLLEDADASVSSVSFELEPEARGFITFRATDYAGNTYGIDADPETEDKWVEDYERINIVDTIAPDRTIILNPTAVYNASDLSNFEGTLAENSEVILYYNEDAMVTFDVVEANFYADDVQFTVTKDDVEYPVEVEWDYLYDNQGERVLDGYRGTFTLVEEGDYCVNISYTDRSLNEMIDKTETYTTYKSQRIVIDKTAPEISVEYYGDTNEQMSPVSVFSDWDNQEREYYDANRYVTITITEKNFRADDVKVIVKAQDVTGADVKVGEITLQEAFLNQGTDREQWTPYEALWRRDDNTYELKLEYTTDANYTFDVEYTDMAKNAQEEDYNTNYFTVDKVDPEHLEVEYDGVVYNTVWDNILNVITLGYYQATVGVTISAEDDIAGVWQMDYEYIKKDGSSEINMASESVTTESITQEGNVFSVKFNVPKEALAPNNQYNGTIIYNTTDRAMRESTSEETRTMVVDNIAPTATISYNAPVKQLGNVSYYAGDINATIVINEANFFSEDVVVTVNDKPVAVSWSDNSVDVHTGTFTLSSDGDYVVKVTYTDRSTNKMEDYTSNQLTIDTKAPVIQVSDVKHESANNGETISFTVQVTDRNIALENFKPSLSVLVKKDNGNNQYSFETVAIDLGQAKTSVNGNGDTVYTYTVENLEVDGFYSLVCEAVDHANHTVSAINSANNADQNTTVETVNFSVNREGSVFWITTEHTEGGETITDQLHGKYVNGEVIVRIHEINVDKVDDGKATIFTLNDGSSAEDIVLDETNYKKNVSIGAGGWYQTDYILDNEYFLDDGVYSINIITYDKATNSNVNTKSEEGTITFTVDRTKPVISANLTSRQIINDTQYKVYFQITELNLNAETIVVKYNGETVALENLGNNEYGFTVKEGLNQSVQITAVDLAGNESELFEAAPFTVSTNIFVRWYATGFWFWFPIIAVPLLIGLIILLIVLKKKKKER